MFGKQAIVLHGAPLTSFDYDLWVSPQSRSEAFSVLNAEGFEPSSSERDKKQIVTFVRDITKIDVFFASGFGRHLSFEECEGRADVLRDEREGFFLRIASIADLIRLKELRGRLGPRISRTSSTSRSFGENEGDSRDRPLREGLRTGGQERSSQCATLFLALHNRGKSSAVNRAWTASRLSLRPSEKISEPSRIDDRDAGRVLLARRFSSPVASPPNVRDGQRRGGSGELGIWGGVWEPRSKLGAFRHPPSSALTKVASGSYF